MKADLTAFGEDFGVWLGNKQSAFVSAQAAHVAKMSSVHAEHARLQSRLAALGQEKAGLEETHSQDVADLTAAQEEVAQLREQARQLGDMQAQVRGHIEEVAAQVKERQDALVAAKQFLRDQAARNPDEVAAFEQRLAMRIDSPREDVVVFVFWNVDPDDYLREVSITVDVSGDGQEHLRYVVVGTSPEVAPETRAALEEEFNRERELAGFLRRARTALREQVAA